MAIRHCRRALVALLSLIGALAIVSAAAAADPTVLVRNDPQLGNILTDPKGMTLYLFNRDTANTSNCYGTCAATWPPLLATGGKLHVGPGLQANLLGTTQRTDGTTQVTYAGHPLYFYAKDTKAGDTSGQAVSGIWWVVSATGAQIGG